MNTYIAISLTEPVGEPAGEREPMPSLTEAVHVFTNSSNVLFTTRDTTFFKKRFITIALTTNSTMHKHILSAFWSNH